MSDKLRHTSRLSADTHGQAGTTNDFKLNKKAVALLSGGLDSRLAVKVMIEQGVEIICLNMVTAFCTCTSKSSCRSEARKAAHQFDVPIKVKNTTMAMIEAIKNPKHGFGKNLNPCIDCRLLMFKEAKKVMDETGSSFIITGEVLGSRPMSQRMEALQLIEKESGLSGLILRPLSARLLPPTLPEKEGLVNREQLLSLHGRSRKEQIELASQKKIKDYPCPAGGCLLTDKSFSDRLRKLLQVNREPTMKEIYLLKYGRHFNIDGYKVIVGRNEIENKMIIKLAGDEDTFVKILDCEGPVTIVQGQGLSAGQAGTCQSSAGNGLMEIIKKAAAITARYSQGRDEDMLKARYWSLKLEEKEISVDPETGYKLVEIYQEEK